MYGVEVYPANEGENCMLSNKALLVYLSISQWTGRKMDKRATKTVEVGHATEKRVGNYTKRLLPGARELDKITAQAAAIRQWVYEQTLPWAVDGARILSSKNYLDFSRDFAQKKSAFDVSVENFLQTYPSLKAEARQKLGDLFSDLEYPSVSTLGAKFKCSVDFMPMPDVQDFRTDVLDSEKQAFLEKMEEVKNKAMSEVWERLYTVVQNAAERLKDPEARFKNAMIENIQEMCQLLPKLNITDNPDLEAMRVSVEQTVSLISSNLCRDNATARQDAAQKLNNITAKMAGFMGAG